MLIHKPNVDCQGGRGGLEDRGNAMVTTDLGTAL